MYSTWICCNLTLQSNHNVQNSHVVPFDEPMVLLDFQDKIVLHKLAAENKSNWYSILVAFDAPKLENHLPAAV